MQIDRVLRVYLFENLIHEGDIIDVLPIGLSHLIFAAIVQFPANASGKMAMKWLASAIRSKWVRLIMDEAPWPASWVPWKTKTTGIDSSKRVGTNIRKVRSSPRSVSVVSRKVPAWSVTGASRK